MYATADTYTITISGTFPRIQLGDFNISGLGSPTTAAGQIRSVEQWGDIAWTSMSFAFAGCENLTINASDVPDLSNGPTMLGMFNAAAFNGDISKWNTSKVTNMSATFWNANFNEDISEWDVSSVTVMSSMFLSSSFNGDLSGWDVGKVTNMERMFESSSFNGDLSGWDV
ncbi:MAG: BspA family leucine-rich repeat surface protein, partial [Ekhidna sp.]|nr:BspA family leucine-rich repeat surface protein [Ekhidna sp.]